MLHMAALPGTFAAPEHIPPKLKTLAIGICSSLNRARDRTENRYPLFLVARLVQMGSVPVEHFNS